MKSLNGIALAIALLISSCQPNKTSETPSKDIAQTIIEDRDSFYFIDFENYPQERKQLPVGVFDSGIGGLTVLKAIVDFDEYDNETGGQLADGRLDFEKEQFIYLGDQANMPYGNYSAENKLDLLQEHIIKDAQFLLGDKYYAKRTSTIFENDKQPVKAIVVACNTATAYGKSHIEDFLSQANANIKVIGVIDAGVRGALERINKDENAIVGVMATAGTVSSKGYRNTIEKFAKDLGYVGKIEVFEQGGVGIAEAVDEDSDYFVKGLKEPREAYKGPDLQGSNVIDKTLLDVYNFDFEHGKMLCDAASPVDCSIMQINDAENYVRYHLVSLLEQIRKSGTDNQLKSIILGCTHYPYLSKEIAQVLGELYNYQSRDGEYVYRKNMVENIVLIDPAINTAKELYAYLNEGALMNPTGDIAQSEFYISVPNGDNPNCQISEGGGFPYAYKYGRKAGQIQEYVKVVPLSRSNISADILQRFEVQIPTVYELMRTFNAQNQKTSFLNKEERI